MTTAEWKCTTCGATNRKLVPTGQTTVQDRCVTCHVRHQVQAGPRPVFWEATAQR
jgi:DNA-directed RNA polymerase subunit RPC12/RpoP